MSFHIFTNAVGNTASAYEVMENFHYIFDGNRLPYNGSSLSAISSTYDIGSSSYKWSQLYCVNLMADSITTTNKTLWGPITYIELSSPALAIEITGLNGDLTPELRMDHYIVYTISVTADSYFVFNGDSATNYGYQYHRAEIGGTTGSMTTTTAPTKDAQSILWGQAYNTSTAKYGALWAYAAVYSGYPKIVQTYQMASFVAEYVGKIMNCDGICSNTETLTSLKIYSSERMDTGTRLELWGRK